MKVSRFEVNPFGEMTYILWDDTTRSSFVVDPGMMYDEERNAIRDFIEKNGLSVKFVLITHIHVDHVASVGWLAKEYGAPVYCSNKDSELLKELPSQAARFHLRIDVGTFVPDRFISEGEELLLNDEEIRVLETPGHSPGSLSFYLPQNEAVLTGDALFNGSIGRTDLPGGDFNQLISSIKDKILSLPPSTLVLPGHGDVTTVEHEVKYNYFIR